MSYKIFIKDLHIKVSIGILPQEKKKKQTIIINTEIELERNLYWKKDSLSPTVLSYDDIMQDIKSICSAGHTNLLETLAERIADKCLQRETSLKVKVKIEKPEIYKDAYSAGVEILRSSGDL